MPDNYSDPELEQQLRDVPLPGGLIGRLRRPDPRDALSWTDQQLDAEIADVAVDDSLLISLRSIPEDAEIDRRLCDVDVPWSLEIQLRQPERQRRRLNLNRLTRAAMIFLALGTLYHFGVGLLLSGLRPESTQQVYLNIQYDGPLEIEAGPGTSTQLAIHSPDLRPGHLRPLPKPDVVVTTPPRDPQVTPVGLGPAGELIDQLNDGLALETDLFQMRYGSLGYPQGNDDPLPRLEDPPAAPRGGVEPPLVREFNRRFLLKYGVNPPVFPGLHPSLRKSPAPLSTSTNSFDVAKHRLAEGRWPVASEVVVEEFIAAAALANSSPAPGTLALQVAAAPSIFGEDRGKSVVKDLGWRPGQARLLQVGAVAGPAPRGKRPIQVTIALDVSSSMRWGGRLETAVAAIDDLAGQLGSRDRLSVLAFNQRVAWHIEGVGRSDRAQLADFLAQLRADGGTNLPLALQEALATSLDATLDMNAQPVLVLMTDGRSNLPVETIGRLSQMFQAATGQGLRFSILELNEDYDADPELVELRAALQADKRTAVDLPGVKRALLEAFSGSDTLVAADAKLTVTFDPDVVFAYRLIGHDAGLIPAAVETNLHAGEVAVCLFEVWLRPGTTGRVGEVRLHWIDAQTGREQRKRLEVATGDFEASFLSAPASLQSAALAAETAETLRGSPLAASRGRSLAHVVEVIDRLNSESLSHRELQSLIRFVKDAERVRQLRSTREM